MDINYFKLGDGSLLKTSRLLGPYLQWMETYIKDLSEDEFWAWLNNFYESGPNADQKASLEKINHPPFQDHEQKDYGWRLWGLIDQIWQNHYDDWHSRGYRPDVIGGWYWRELRNG